MPQENDEETCDCEQWSEVLFGKREERNYYIEDSNLVFD